MSDGSDAAWRTQFLQPYQVGPHDMVTPPSNAWDWSAMFGGMASYAIGAGIFAILIPILTHIYFPVVAIFGLWRAFVAYQRGQVVGGALGAALNVLGILVSLGGLIR